LLTVRRNNCVMVRLWRRKKSARGASGCGDARFTATILSRRFFRDGFIHLISRLGKRAPYVVGWKLIRRKFARRGEGRKSTVFPGLRRIASNHDTRLGLVSGAPATRLAVQLTTSRDRSSGTVVSITTVSMVAVAVLLKLTVVGCGRIGVLRFPGSDVHR